MSIKRVGETLAGKTPAGKIPSTDLRHADGRKMNMCFLLFFRQYAVSKKF